MVASFDQQNKLIGEQTSELTASRISQRFLSLFPGLSQQILDPSTGSPFAGNGTRVVSIGPVTSATAREHGLEVAVEASQHDTDGLVDALLADAAGR